MNKFKEALLEEQRRLEDIIAKAEMENEHFPDGYLRISKNKNRCRYYHCIEDRNGSYIPKSNIELSKQLAQKSYNKSVIDKFSFPTVSSYFKLSIFSSLNLKYSVYE